MEGRMERRMEEIAKMRIEEFTKGHGEIPDFGNRVGKSWEVVRKKSGN